MSDDLFYKLPKPLVRAAGYYSPKNGEAIPFTSTAKIVYVHMLDRLHFFVDKQKGKHFEAQQTIAEACGMEYKAVGKVLRDFISTGVLEAKKGRELGNGSVHNRYYYTSIKHDLAFWTGSIRNPEKMKKSSYTKTETPKRSLDNTPSWLDIEDPF